jgi:muramoyltetrapeptide carboxypeptidase LdcA involved in peptidoglycan recycling
MAFTTPPPMEPGDKVAVVAPAAGAAAAVPAVYEQGLRRLRGTFDLEPVAYPTAGRDSEYLAAHPEERARDVEDAFVDPDVAGVIATIGGHDQLRILPHLDPDVLRDNPTRFYGYSDNTNLTAYLWDLGIVSYQGPAVMTHLAYGGGVHDYTERYCRRAFFEEAIGAVEPAERFTDDNVSWARDDATTYERAFEASPGWRWRAGDGEAHTGRVWGGCLESLGGLLMADVAVPDPAELDGAVLFFETSEELRSAGYVHEVLQSMGERGLLERFGAVVAGRAKARTYEEDPGPEARQAHRERQRDVVRETVARYSPDAPVLTDFDFGHTDPIVPVPIGGRVTVDPAAERVVFE